MKSHNEDLLLEQSMSKQILKPRRSRTSRGPLHDRITKFLPDFVDEEDNVANLNRIAVALGMTYQGVYKMMRPGEKNRISPKVAERLVELSRKSKTVGVAFRPATIEDFWEFIAV